MTAVTINGNAYSDDGSQSRDMRGSATATGCCRCCPTP